MDSPDQARTAVAVLTPLVHATPASALTNPTPCDKWAVRDLLNHLVGGGYMFAAGLNGDALDGDPNADLLGDDHIAAYDGAIDAFSSALADASDLSAPVTLPFATLPADMALRIAARGPARARLGPRGRHGAGVRPAGRVRRIGHAFLRRVHQPSIAGGRPLRSGGRAGRGRHAGRAPRRARRPSTVSEASR